MKQLLIVWHSMTGGSEALARSAYEGAAHEDGVTVRLLHADTAQAEDMLASDGYLFVFPENLAAIAGVMKAFFDRVYYPCLGQMEGRCYAVIICAGSDGHNAAAQAERIATGWRLKKMADTQIVCTHAQTPEAILEHKIIDATALEAAAKTGATFAAGLALGIF
jgi:NAD(P)H-dependent FMN reductase